MNPRVVHEFWFGDVSDWVECVTRNSERWFQRGHELDVPIRERFGALLACAGRGDNDHWLDTAQGALALILVLDQFPRHIHRGSAAAFDFDHKALRTCRLGIERGVDAQLSAVERSFFYLPMEHAEDLQMQDQSVASMHANSRGGPPQLREFLQNSARYAELHRDLITRFGRFPHRNSLLGRTSTEQETAYLEGGGQRFGQ